MSLRELRALTEHPCVVKGIALEPPSVRKYPRIEGIVRSRPANGLSSQSFPPRKGTSHRFTQGESRFEPLETVVVEASRNESPENGGEPNPTGFHPRRGISVEVVLKQQLIDSVR